MVFELKHVNYIIDHYNTEKIRIKESVEKYLRIKTVASWHKMTKIGENAVSFNIIVSLRNIYCTSAGKSFQSLGTLGRVFVVGLEARNRKKNPDFQQIFGQKWKGPVVNETDSTMSYF